MKNTIKIQFTDINGTFKIKRVTPLQLQLITPIAPDLRII